MIASWIACVVPASTRPASGEGVGLKTDTPGGAVRALRAAAASARLLFRRGTTPSSSRIRNRASTPIVMTAIVRVLARGTGSLLMLVLAVEILRRLPLQHAV